MRSILIASLLLASCAVGSAADGHCAAPAAAAVAVADVSITDLKQAIADKKVVLLDANGTTSYAAGHIPGAIDVAATADLAKALPGDKGVLIVAYCGGPKCGAWKAAAAKATALGYTQVKHFSAGIAGWKDAKEPVEAAKPN